MCGCACGCGRKNRCACACAAHFQNFCNVRAGADKNPRTLKVWQNFMLKSGNSDKILFEILSPNTRSHQLFLVHIVSAMENGHPMKA